MVNSFTCRSHLQSSFCNITYFLLIISIDIFHLLRHCYNFSPSLPLLQYNVIAINIHRSYPKFLLLSSEENYRLLSKESGYKGRAVRREDSRVIQFIVSQRGDMLSAVSRRHLLRNGSVLFLLSSKLLSTSKLIELYHTPLLQDNRLSVCG